MVEDATGEVRFAVVLYGGVSLAIYMNGIAQELLRMVRGSSDLPDEDLDTYPALVGSLNYLACCTRPDIAQAVSALSRHL